MNDNDKQPGPDGGGNNWARNLLLWVGIAVALAVLASSPR
jgi:cell division protease FtsH